MFPKRGAIAGFLTAAGLALLLSFKTPEVTSLPPGQGGNTAFNGGNQTGNGTTNTGSTAPAGNGGNTGAAYSGTVTGQAVQIPFGTVQVQVTVQNGKITDVQALQMPGGDRHTSQISNFVAPRLRTEALQAQSASINAISGATYTSEGYIQSLQSALDQAHA
jgi:uncharacterized protein with FMN-binding domain